MSVLSLSVAPSSAPTNLKAYPMTTTSIFLTWRPPAAESWNGIIRGYYVEITDNTRTVSYKSVTDDPYFLVKELRTNHKYTFKVAAYTTEPGPYSNSTISQSLKQGVLLQRNMYLNTLPI